MVAPTTIPIFRLFPVLASVNRLEKRAAERFVPRYLNKDRSPSARSMRRAGSPE